MAAVLLIGPALLAVVGCGQSGAYSVVPSTGTVKYDDGSVIPAGRIELRFISQEPAQDAGTHPRQGITEVNVEDGTFDYVSTYKHGDGLIRGEHKVIARSIAPGGGYTPAIGEQYASESSTPLVVQADGKPIDLVIEKP